MLEDVFQPPSSRVLAGAARADISPPDGIHCRCWGASPHDTASSLHHPLTATALALRAEAGGPPLVLLGLDLSSFEPAENRRFLVAVRDAADLAADHLLVNLCHTHAAPTLAFDLANRPGGDRIFTYFQEVVDRSIEIIRDAVNALRPGWITAEYGRCALASNRNYVDAAFGETLCGFNPHAPADDTLAYARIVGDDGATVASVLNYGCHPTSLGPMNTAMSPDYIAEARRVVEEADGGPCLFLIGPCGDTAPRNTYASDPSEADRNGRQLGHAAASVAASLLPPGKEMFYTGPLISGATLATWAQRDMRQDSYTKVRTSRLKLDLPLRAKEGIATLEGRHRQWLDRREEAERHGDDLGVQNAEAMLERSRRAMTREPELPEGDTLHFEAWIWQLGRIVVVGLPAEPFSQLQVALRKRFPSLCIVVAMNTNGTCGYLMPETDFGRGLYQEWISPTGPGSFETLLTALETQIMAWNP